MFHKNVLPFTSLGFSFVLKLESLPTTGLRDTMYCEQVLYIFLNNNQREHSQPRKNLNTKTKKIIIIK